MEKEKKANMLLQSRKSMKAFENTDSFFNDIKKPILSEQEEVQEKAEESGKEDGVEDGASEALETEIEQFSTLADEALEELEEEEESGEYSCILPTHVRVEYKTRTIGNQILFLIYKMLRIIMVSVWFYFVPFVAMFASYVIPAYMQKHYPQTPETK